MQKVCQHIGLSVRYTCVRAALRTYTCGCINRTDARTRGFLSQIEHTRRRGIVGRTLIRRRLLHHPRRHLRRSRCRLARRWLLPLRGRRCVVTCHVTAGSCGGGGLAAGGGVGGGRRPSSAAAEERVEARDYYRDVITVVARPLLPRRRRGPDELRARLSGIAGACARGKVGREHLCGRLALQELKDAVRPEQQAHGVAGCLPIAALDAPRRHLRLGEDAHCARDMPHARDCARRARVAHVPSGADDALAFHRAVRLLVHRQVDGCVAPLPAAQQHGAGVARVGCVDDNAAAVGVLLAQAHDGRGTAVLGRDTLVHLERLVDRHEARAQCLARVGGESRVLRQVLGQVVKHVLRDELAFAAVAVKHAHERALRVASERRAHTAAVLVDLRDHAAGAWVDSDATA
eukprot:scaffold31059_cov70-Phaeocystis_antarctica.AAC.2